MLLWGARARVTCYHGARVSHVTLGRACHMLPRGAGVTCYPGARVAHVTPGRPCHTGEAKRLIGRRYLFLRARHEAVCTKLFAEVLLFCDD